MISRQNYATIFVTREEFNDLLEDYWDDIYDHFICDCIQPAYTVTGAPDITARLKLSDIYTRFKRWFRINFPGFRTPERSAVRSVLTTRWGHMIYNAWPGIQLITDNNATNI